MSGVALASLFIKVDATQPAAAARTLDSLTASGAKAESAIGGVTTATGRLSAETSRATNVVGMLGGALAGAALVTAAREAVQLTDAYKSMQGRLSLVTDSTFQLSKVTAELFDVAQDTRGALEGTVDLYGRLARSTKSLGASQADLIAVTQTINESIIVSGASAQAADAALMQLGQGFASGALRGEELNSVLEQTPRLAQAIADGMGVTVGQLRALGAEGKITASSVFEALKGQGDVVAAEFARMPLTVAQAFTQVENAVLKYVGQSDAAIASSTQLAAAISFVAENIDTIAAVLINAGMGAAAFAVIVGVRMVAAFVADTIAALAASNAIRAYAMSVAIAGPVSATAAVAVDALTLSALGLSRVLAFFGGPIGIAIIAVGTAIAAVGMEAAKTTALVQEAGDAVKGTTTLLNQMGLAAAGASAGTTQVGAASHGAAVGVETFGGKAGVAAEQLYGLAAAAKYAAYESLVAQRAMLGGKLADVSLRTQEGRRADAVKDYGKDFLGAAGSAVRLVAGEGRALLDGGARDRELAAAKNDLSDAIARVDAGLKEVAGTATEKYIPATVKAATESDKAAKGAKGHKTAIDEAARAMERATDSADDYLARLRQETEEYGKSGSAIKALEVARAAAASPDRATAAAITEEGGQLAGLMKGAEQIAEINSGLVTMREAWGDIDFESAALDELIVELQLVDSLALSAGAGMERAFGGMGRAVGGITAAVTGLRVQMAALEKMQQENTINAAQRVRAEASLRIGSYGDMTMAAKGFFKEGSSGYELLEGAEKAFRIIEFGLAVQAIAMKGAEATAAVAAESTITGAALAGAAVRTPAKAAEGIAGIFAALGPFGFPVAAAATAVMVAAGVKMFGGGGGAIPGSTDMETRQKRQGSGSVLGDAAAQSESLTRAIELVAENSNSDLEYSNDMLKALRSIDSQIGLVAASLARSLGASGALNTDALGLGKSADGPGVVARIMAPISNLLPGLFGTTTKRTLQDQGLSFGGQSLADILGGGIQGETYQQVLEQTKKKAFGVTYSNKSKSETTTGELDAQLAGQITDVIGSLKSGVLSAAGILGVTGADAVLDAFQVNLGKLSFKDMSGSEIQEALNGIFGKLGDDLAATAIPALADLQKVGEGAFETLARVARNYQVLDTSLASIGMTFGAVGVASLSARERLVDLAGGMDELVEQTKFFGETFLSDLERMAPVQRAVTAELDRLGLAGVTTKDAFKTAVLGLDLTTEAGAKTYAALLALAPAFSKVVDFASEGSQAVQDALSALAAAYERDASAAMNARDKFLDLAKVLNDFGRSLDPLLDATTGASLDRTRREFLATASSAATGNADSMAALPALGEAFRAASEANASSLMDYQRDVATIQNAVKAAENAATVQASAADQQLQALQASVSGILLVNESVLSVRDALAAYNGAIAAQASAAAPPVSSPVTEPVAPGPAANDNPAPERGPDWASYIAHNADVDAAYAKEMASSKGRANLLALGATSVEAFGQLHWNTKGKGEGRTPYATGGIIDRPMTLGESGIGGEAGHEGILPLAKVGGKMGVHAVGDNGAAAAELRTLNAKVERLEAALISVAKSNSQLAMDMRALVERGIWARGETEDEAVRTVAA